MVFRVIFLLSVCACFLLSTSSLAEVIPLTQSRTVYCFALATDDELYKSDADSASAADFELFNEAVWATIYLGASYASGSGHQLSAITPVGFFISGGCSANGEGYEEWGYGEAVGRTFYQCQFEVPAPIAYTLAGNLEASDGGDASLQLTGPGMDLYLEAGYNNILPVDEAGDLAPGIYLLTVQANSSAYGDFFAYGYAYSQFDLEMDFAGTSATPVNGRDDLALRLSPNPFSHGTEIAYSAPGRPASSLEIFDLRGHLVRSLATGAQESGLLSWDGKNSHGQNVATGTYFVLLRSGNEIRREKALLVR